LQGGHTQKALELFLKDQAHDIFPKGPDTLKWLTENVGNKAAKKLIGALARLACFNCERGLNKCENCNGTGHFDHEMVCESCLGLGSTSCDFCGGTGLTPIDFIPVGLRLGVFAIRLELPKKQIADLLRNPVVSSPAENPEGVFSSCADALLNLNRQISVLESATDVSADLIEVPGGFSKRMTRVTQKALRAAIDGEMRLAETVACMAGSCELQARNSEEGVETRKLARARKKFYSSLFSSKPPLAMTYLEHMSLREAAKKLSSNRAVSHGA
jgi:hypothetical protein